MRFGISQTSKAIFLAPRLKALPTTSVFLSATLTVIVIEASTEDIFGKISEREINQVSSADLLTFKSNWS